jgi:hypothetical protein
MSGEMSRELSLETSGRARANRIRNLRGSRFPYFRSRADNGFFRTLGGQCILGQRERKRRDQEDGSGEANGNSAQNERQTV